MSGRHKRERKIPPPMEIPNFLGAARSAEEALRLVASVVRDNHGVSAEDGLKAAIITGEMRKAVERGEGDLALEIRCSSKHRGRPCLKSLAMVWTFPEGGHYVRTKIRTNPYRRETVLLTAMAQQEQGMPNVAKLTESLADVAVRDYDFLLEAPSPTEDAVEVACPTHGYVHVDRFWMHQEAVGTRRTSFVDVAAVPR